MFDCIFTCFDEYLLYNDSFLFEPLRNCETVRGSFYPLTTELCKNMFIIIQATWKFYKRIGGSVSGIYKKVTV